MTACTDTCKRPSPAQAHCATCHRTFGGVTGFDRHRRNGACIDPATVGYELVVDVWRLPMPADELARRKALAS